jgi:hypothetical protein
MGCPYFKVCPESKVALKGCWNPSAWKKCLKFKRLDSSYINQIYRRLFSFSNSFKKMIIQIAKDKWICPFCLSKHVALWKSASICYLKDGTKIETMILGELYKYCTDCKSDIHDHNYDSIEKWYEYSNKGEISLKTYGGVV